MRQEFAKVGTMGGPISEIDLDARSVAMGSASMAFSSDAGAAFRNPAGWSNRRLQFYRLLCALVRRHQPVRRRFRPQLRSYGVAGIHFIYLNSGEMEETTVDQQQGTGSMFSVSDFAFGLSYARRLTDKFSIGGNLRWIHEIFTSPKLPSSAWTSASCTTPVLRLCAWG